MAKKTKEQLEYEKKPKVIKSKKILKNKNGKPVIYHGEQDAALMKNNNVTFEINVDPDEELEEFKLEGKR